MTGLLWVGFVAGLVTGISPCVLPVLPAILAGGATSADKIGRPVGIVLGLVVSFTFVTLAEAAFISALGLHADLLRDLGVGLLFVVGIGFVVSGVGRWIEKPFARLGGRMGRLLEGTDAQGQPRTSRWPGLALGLVLGLVFTPCAGPVFSAVGTAVGHHRIGWTTVGVTLCFALGAAVPILVISIGANRALAKVLLRRSGVVRKVGGVVIALTAVVLFFNWTTGLTKFPGYTARIQNAIEGSKHVLHELDAMSGESTTAIGTTTTATRVSLTHIGPAPTFTGITAWLNTPGPLTLTSLKGKVVLVDFWTYSCINCERSIPHVEAWYQRYHRDGFEVIGVHTPEFPFEHVVSNVQAADAQLGVTYPVAIDNNMKTWTAFGNHYWPAEYLIDSKGEVRHTDFGEGQYKTTEQDIRTLLMARGVRNLPPSSTVPDRTPTTQLTTETYLGSDRFTPTRYVGSAVIPGQNVDYTLAHTVPQDEISFGGTWRQEAWDIAAGSGAELELSYTASEVYLVLGGTGTVQVEVNGQHSQTIDVGGVPKLYTVRSGAYGSGELTLSMSPGVDAYDFTFG